MKLIDILRVAFSTFTNNKMRTILTILGVAIGISTIIFLVSIGYGLQQITIGDIQSIKALTSYDVSTGNSSILALNKNSLDTFSKIPNVKSVDPLLSMSGQITLEGKQTDALVNAASANYVNLESPKMTTGNIYTNDNDKNIVVTTVVANAFNIKPADLVGKKVSVIFYVPNPQDSQNPTEQTLNLTISGVVDDTSAAYLYMPIGLINIPDNVNLTGAKVEVNNSSNMNGVNSQLEKMGYQTTSIGEKITEMDRIFRIAQIILLIFGAIGLIVASIGMFNTLTISLLERTKDIGIMKALGATDRSVYAIFLAESTIISVFGGIVGIALAMILGFITNTFLSALAIRAGGQSVAVFQAPWTFVLIIFAFSIVVGILTGLYPSRRAARIDPLDALRYE
jgi:ABC-type antimicrobial peptide transport system permease subunit